MKYDEFVKFVETECAYEAMYEDSDGREILVIRTLDAFHMLNKAAGRLKPLEFGKAIEEKPKEKNA